MPAAGWHCEWIYIVEDLPETSSFAPQGWYFPCNRWLKGDGKSRVIPIDLLPLDAKAAPAVALTDLDVILPPADAVGLPTTKTSTIQEREFPRTIEKTGMNF